MVVLIIPLSHFLGHLFFRVNLGKINLSFDQRVTSIFLHNFFNFHLLSLDLQSRRFIGQKLIEFLLMYGVFNLSLRLQKPLPILFFNFLLLKFMFHLLFMPFLFQSLHRFHKLLVPERLIYLLITLLLFLRELYQPGLKLNPIMLHHF